MVRYDGAVPGVSALALPHAGLDSHPSADTTAHGSAGIGGGLALPGPGEAVRLTAAVSVYLAQSEVHAAAEDRDRLEEAEKKKKASSLPAMLDDGLTQSTQIIRKRKKPAMI